MDNVTPYQLSVDVSRVREYEQQLLSGLILHPHIITDVMNHIHPSHLISASHRDIYTIVCQMPVSSVALDINVLRTRLVSAHHDPKRVDLYLELLCNLHISEAATLELALLLWQLSTVRQLSQVTTDLSAKVQRYTGDINALLDECEASILQIASSHNINSTVSLQELVNPTLYTIEQWKLGIIDSGVSTSLPALDALIGGLTPTNLILIGARPSVGKSALAITIAKHVAEQQVGVLYVSLEMHRSEIMQRLLSQSTGVDITQLRDNGVTDTEFRQLTDVTGQLGELPFYIEDQPAMTIFDIKTRARRLKQDKNIGLVVVDYLQLIASFKTENRQVEVSDISRQLKVLARELDIPVIAISQLNRGVEVRQDKKPLLADLRESGALEQDADIVLLLHRNMDSENNVLMPSNSELTVAKNRHGPIGNVPLQFLANKQLFTQRNNSNVVALSTHTSRSIGLFND